MRKLFLFVKVFPKWAFKVVDPSSSSSATVKTENFSGVDNEHSEDWQPSFHEIINLQTFRQFLTLGSEQQPVLFACKANLSELRIANRLKVCFSN